MARRIDPPTQAGDDTSSDYVRTGGEPRRWGVLTATVVAVAVLSVGGVVWARHDDATPTAQASSDPVAPEAKPEEGPTGTQPNTTDWAAQVAANAPMPKLPADQAQLWRDAFQSMADCMHTHGIKGFPDAPATFGDGMTASPTLGVLTDTGDGAPTSEQYGKAMAACPFDDSKLDPAAFAAAGQEWLERSGQSGLPTPPAG